jgi:hypothetical protein
MSEESDEEAYTIYRPTSIRDIYNIIGYKVGFVLGSELYVHLKHVIDGPSYLDKGLNPLDDFMFNGAFVLLLNDTKDIGHWVSVSTNGDQRCYFDPYGEEPPKWLKPYISNYMNKSIQASTTAACGYHCALFLRSFWMSEDSYRKQFDPLTKPTARDEFVVAICNHLMACNGYDYHS